jgi:hypothetical protein
MEDAVYVASESNYLRRIEVESLATLEKVSPNLTLCFLGSCSLLGVKTMPVEEVCVSTSLFPIHVTQFD